MTMRGAHAVAPVLGALVMLGAMPAAAAQSDYPNRPLRLIVPYAPGGGADAAVRVLVESTDGTHVWRTVGASTDVVEASWLALQDAYEYWITRWAPRA